MKMRPRHLPDSSRVIAEVLGERRNVTTSDLKEYLDRDDDEVLLLVAETSDGTFAGVAGRNRFSREAVLKDWYNDGGDAVLMSRRIREVATT